MGCVAVKVLFASQGVAGQGRKGARACQQDDRGLCPDSCGLRVDRTGVTAEMEMGMVNLVPWAVGQRYRARRSWKRGCVVFER